MAGTSQILQLMTKKNAWIKSTTDKSRNMYFWVALFPYLSFILAMKTNILVAGDVRIYIINVTNPQNRAFISLNSTFD